MSLLSMCSNTVTLQRETITKDAAGGVRRSWGDVSGATDIPADIQPASGRTVLAYMQQQLHVSHTIFLSQDVSATRLDRFISGSRIYKINGYRPAQGRTSWPAVADCEEVINS